MINFPNAKINLGLRVTAKREDGYHDLDTVFYPLPLTDILEIIVNPDPEAEPVIFSISGKTIPGEDKDNICIKAFHVIKKDFPHIPPVLIHLHKNIPMGAGMGGGSSDGVHMLMLLNEKFRLSLSKVQLEAYALQLGSDCPFFIINKPAHATGRGEQLNEILFDLRHKKILLVSPGIHVSTAAAFARILITKEASSCAEIISKPIAEWRNLLINDFEKNVFALHPEIAGIKENLYQLGANYASMTGTGSTVYGIFDDIPQIKHLFPDHYELTWIEAGRVHRG